MTVKMDKYLEFMSELEKLKTVTRMNHTLDPGRQELAAFAPRQKRLLLEGVEE